MTITPSGVTAQPDQLERALFEVKKVIVGQDRVIERILVCLLSRGHCLLEGVPGVAKTLTVETIAKVTGGSFTRIQFTPDLLPSDMIGTRIYRQSSERFDVELGPIFANFVLADEINRAPAKVQSALLEIMAERQVSIGGTSYPAPTPFLVLATQNPIESEGVYPLPEAQRDRFLMKINVGYPTPAEEIQVVVRMGVSAPEPEQTLGLDQLIALQELADGCGSTRASSTTPSASCWRPGTRARSPCPSWHRSSPTGPARGPASGSCGPPAPSPCSGAAHMPCPRTCSTSLPTSCDIDWCSRTKLSPRRGPRITSCPEFSAPFPRRRSRLARADARPRVQSPRRPRGGPRPGAGDLEPAPSATGGGTRPSGDGTHPGRAPIVGARRGRRRLRRRSAHGPAPLAVGTGGGLRCHRPGERFGRSRSPMTPTDIGLGSADHEVLRRIELQVTRRLDGLLHGDYRGLVPGQGSEAGEAREYAPGDDVRHMDWNVTARTTIPHIREMIADRELESRVLVDLSASLSFGTADRTKRDLAVAAAAAVGFVTSRQGNRFGLLAIGDGRTREVPARGGRSHLLGALRVLQQPGDQSDAAPLTLAAGLNRLGATFPRRGLAVVISDLLEPPGWDLGLRRLGVRHDVLVVEIVDPRELELPAVGLLSLRDTESGRVRQVQTNDPRLRQRYRDAAAAQRASHAAMVRASGADHLVLRTDRDWLLDLVRFVATRRERLALTGGTP